MLFSLTYFKIVLLRDFWQKNKKIIINVTLEKKKKRIRLWSRGTYVPKSCTSASLDLFLHILHVYVFYCFKFWTVSKDLKRGWRADDPSIFPAFAHAHTHVYSAGPILYLSLKDMIVVYFICVFVHNDHFYQWQCNICVYAIPHLFILCKRLQKVVVTSKKHNGVVGDAVHMATLGRSVKKILARDLESQISRGKAAFNRVKLQRW